MNKKFFEQYMHTEPLSPENKYLFLVDNQDIAFAILAAGYQPTLLLPDDDAFYSLDSFLDHMDEIALTGTYQIDYYYIPACSSKRINDELEQYFKRNSLKYQEGWTLFKNKEYLAKFENQNELKSVLSRFILRFEYNPRENPDIDKFHIYNEKGKRIGVFDMEIVDYLIDTVSFFMLGDTPYIYNHGVYEEDSGGYRLKAKIQNLLYRDCIKSTTIQRVYNLLVSQPQVQRKFSELNNQPSHWINFKNGYYDVMKEQMIAHDEKYLMINQIPFCYYPESAPQALEGGQNMKQYLNISLPNKTEQLTYWQFLGYAMTTDTRFQKFLTFKGQGGTGKSVAIAVIQHIVGTNNCSAISLQDLNRRFYATGLHGKLLNACADIPSVSMDSDDVVKKATGEDTLLYEKKGHDPTQFHSYAKLVFSANRFPKNSKDKSNALYRRMLVLEMNHIIPDTAKDRQLKEKLFSESDYIIHMAMFALKKLYDDGKFTESTHSQECIAKLRQASDSVQAFLDESTQPKENSRLLRSQVFKAYLSYCEEYEKEPLSKSNFFLEMEEHGFAAKQYNTGWMYCGLEWIDTEFKPVTTEDSVPFEQMDLVTKFQR